MIPVIEMLYDIDLKLNKVATAAHQSIPLEDKIITLNDAQIALVKKKVGNGSPVGAGLDGYKKQYEDLQVLIVPHSQISLEADGASAVNRYVASILPSFPDYLFFVDAYFLCSKGPCRNHRVAGLRIKHADLQRVLSNSNTCPSFRYQEMPVTVSENTLECYTDGSFTVEVGFLSYLRYPQRIDMEGYLGFDGNPSLTVDSELPYYLKDELVHLAVEQLAISTENQPAAQYALIKNQQN